MILANPWRFPSSARYPTRQASGPDDRDDKRLFDGGAVFVAGAHGDRRRTGIPGAQGQHALAQRNGGRASVAALRLDIGEHFPPTSIKPPRSQGETACRSRAWCRPTQTGVAASQAERVLIGVSERNS